MARAKRKSVSDALSPVDEVAKRAEALALARFDLRINGQEFVTEDLTIDVARMYFVLLTRPRQG